MFKKSYIVGKKPTEKDITDFYWTYSNINRNPEFQRYRFYVEDGMKIAEKIYNYPEVESLYLMSGGFDLAVFIKGKTMREVAFFVAEKLSTIEDVISTSTHFMLRKYKDNNIIYGAAPVDERGIDF